MLHSVGIVPPSIMQSAPLMNAPRSEARKATSSAKRNDGSNHALVASKVGNSAITIRLDGIALQTLKATVVDEDIGLVTCEGSPKSCPSKNLQLRLTQGSSYA